MLDKTDENNSKKTSNLDEDKRTEQKKLCDFALSRIDKLIVSDNNSDEVIARIKHNGHMETIVLSSNKAIHWLTNEHTQFGNPNELHSSDYYKTILNAIKSKAIMDTTTKTKTFKRVAQLENEIWYDLGNSSWQALRITSNGIKTVNLDSNSPVFIRTQSLQEQVIPRMDNNFALDELANLLHIAKSDQLVFKVHVACLFLEAYPMPMMVFDGSAGSIKTTATATIKAIVDPSGKYKEDNVSMMAEKPHELVNQLYNRYLPSFDNVGYFDSKISDVLCRAITGSSNQKRRLYTDNDEFIQSFRSKIVLNGIVPSIDYPDLQTRLISYERDIIDESNLITESEFNQKFKDLLPSILGQIFTILSNALKKHPTLHGKIKPKTRMSDFEVWGEIISRCMGNPSGQFLKEYRKKILQRNISSQDTYPMIQAIEILMKDKDSFEDSVSNFYKDVSHIVEEKLGINPKDKHVRFPNNANQVKRNLTIIETQLRNLGFDVSTYYWTKNDPKFTKHASIVKIRRIQHQSSLLEDTEKPSLPSPPSLPSLPSPTQVESSHKTKTGESSEGSESYKRYFCNTCRAGPFAENESSSLSGNIVEFHKKLGHNLKIVEI